MTRAVLSAAAVLVGVAGIAATAAADPANAGKVIITEIFANPNDSDGAGFGIRAAGDNLEFIEIYNTTSEVIDISGWYLDDEDATSGAPFPPGTTIGPHQALAIIGAQLGLRPNDPANPGEYLPDTSRWTYQLFDEAFDPTPGDGNAPPRNVLIVPGNITIANTPTIFNEVPFLVDADGDVVDIANYENSVDGWPAVTAGQSIVLKPQFLNAMDNDRGCAWQLASMDSASLTSNSTAFVYTDPGTGTITTRDRLCDAGNSCSPGIVNDVIPPFTDCNNNGIDDAIDTCGVNGSLADCNGNGIPDSCEPDCNGNGIPDTCDASFNREFQDCNLNNIPDGCDIDAAGGANGRGGTLDTNNNGILDACEDAGKVIITEIMVDDATSPQMEWVEIYNRSTTPVDISGYRLLDLETGGDGYTLPVPAGNTLQPGESAVLCANPNTLSDADTVTLYQAAWGAATPQGQPIRWIPLGGNNRWGARATNGTPNAEVLTLVRAAEIDDAFAATQTFGSTSGPHPTRTVRNGTTWVINPGYVVDVANYSNANSNGEPLAGWPGTDNHGSFYLLGNSLNATSNNDGPNWHLSIEGLDGVRRSNDLGAEPVAAGITGSGEDFGSPGYIPTGAPQQPTGEVIISEIAATTNSIYPGSNPTPPTGQSVAGGRDEFCEILNTSTSPVDISGWYLQDEDGRTQPFPAGTVLQPNEAAVIIGADDFVPAGSNQPNLQPLTGRDFRQEFYDAWGCGYKVIPVTDWYSSNGYFGLDRLADAPSYQNEILRLVKGNGTVVDIVNYDDDDTPTAIAQPPFGWPNDGTSGIDIYWSIYTLPGAYTATANDNGVNWASSLTGFDGGRQNVINAAVDGNGFPTGIYNRSMYGTPGYVEGLTGPVTPPGAGCQPCLADFNHSGAVTVQDIFDFLAAYFSQDPAADINNSGGVTVQDIFDFLALYFAGC